MHRSVDSGSGNLTPIIRFQTRDTSVLGLPTRRVIVHPQHPLAGGGGSLVGRVQHFRSHVQSVGIVVT